MSKDNQRKEGFINTTRNSRIHALPLKLTPKKIIKLLKENKSLLFELQNNKIS